MATFIKGKLKAARDAISKKDFAAAEAAATQVLSYEANNYNANVFLGLACLELGKVEDSEKAYRNATNANPDQALAWQGLSKLYERTNRWAEYADTLQRLIDIFAQAEDGARCAETLQKLIDMRRERGSRAELIAALGLVLPDSCIYNTLCLLPPPEPTAPTAHSAHEIQVIMQNNLPVLEEIVKLSEADEEEAIRKEVDKRRKRLGAPSFEEIKKAVAKEIICTSKLPAIYEEVLNHTHTSDDLRRATEAKLLRYKHRQMTSLSLKGDEAAQKMAIRSEVHKMASGAVLLDIPDELAWTIFIEWKDTETIEGYDFKILRRYRSIFPSSALSRAIGSYMRYAGIPTSEDKEDEDEISDTPVYGDADSDPLELLLEATENAQNSVLAYRMLAEVFKSEKGWENLIPTSEKGLELVHRNELETGQKLLLVTKAFNISLATALVHFYPPKHHVRALRTLDAVLAQDADNPEGLMGRGYVAEHAKKWGEAAIIFSKVIQLQKGGTRELEALEERAWCWIMNEQSAKGEEALREVIARWDAEPSCETQQARSWWRLGRLLWELGGDRRGDSFKCFITSLKRSSAFAPAFTALGVYYLEATSPPDPSRASKCFQKAFELDPREGEAARRLAESFAEEGEWDLTEVVARRTIEGEGGLEGGKAGADSEASRRYLPTNSWAWKAMGAVELNRRNYPAAIQAMQVALRAEQTDHLCWLRLGEAYARSGRHIAAIKALSRAQELQPDDWVCSYLMGEVLSEIGQFEEAIGIFEDVLLRRPEDPAIILTLASTCLSFGKAQLGSGYLSRAEDSFWDCIRGALKVISGSSTFRRVGWKIACDALYELSYFFTFEDQEKAESILREIEELLRSNHRDDSNSIEKLLASEQILGTLGLGSDGKTTLKLEILASQHRVAITSYDKVGVSNAWFDLSVGLRRLATVSSSDTVLCSDEALRCIKQALRADSREPSYWNALGVMTFQSNAALSQHAFLSALKIDAKDPIIWINLGLLYLQRQDAELASQALLRAQTLDPDQALAWVGQALVAVFNGDESDANALFEHAVVLSAGSMLEASHMFGVRVLQTNYGLDRSQARSDRLFLAFSALDRYCRERPNDATVLHLHGLICEQLGQAELAEQQILRAISLLEKHYEATEDAAVERRFAMAHGNLGRLRLANGLYSEAIESFDTVLSILHADLADHDSIVMRAHGGLGSGIAYFMLNNFEQALSVLEDTLGQLTDGETDIRGHVTLLLAKVLWAIGSDEARETAKGLLLDCIAGDPHNLAAITALASIGSLTADDGLVQAALSEIQGMELERRTRIDPEGDVNCLLQLHYLAQNDVKTAVAVVQDALHAQPSSASARRDFTRLLLLPDGALSDSRVALQAIIPATLRDGDEDPHMDPDESIRLQVLAKLRMAEDGDVDISALGEIQKAIMMAPWKAENWATLSAARSLAIVSFP